MKFELLFHPTKYNNGDCVSDHPNRSYHQHRYKLQDILDILILVMMVASVSEFFLDHVELINGIILSHDTIFFIQ